jgi:alpha-amylase
VKPLFWLGEFDELENPAYGEVFDASYSWSWMHHAAEYMKAPGDTTDLMNILKRYDDLGDHTMRAWFTTNHDENSWNGTEFEKYGPLAPALAVFSATWNGIPLLYSGQELPNTKRLAFFDKDPIEWNGTYILHRFYQTLLQLHTEHPALRGGDTSVSTMRVKTNAGKQLLAYLRRWREKEVLVFLNFTADTLSVEINDNNVKGTYRDVFSNEQKDLGSIRDLTLEPYGYFVFEK